MRSRTLAALWAPLALFGCGGFMRLGVIAGAHQLFERGECAQLLQRAGSSSSLFEGHPELRARLSFLEAQCLSRMQRESEARALYRYLIEQHPTTPEAYRARALAGVPAESEELSEAEREQIHRECLAAEHRVAPLSRVEPEYPADARALGLEGWVIVQFELTPEGRVVQAAARAARPTGSFEAAALAAVSQWIYEPYSDPGPGDASARRSCALLRFHLAPAPPASEENPPP